MQCAFFCSGISFVSCAPLLIRENGNSSSSFAYLSKKKEKEGNSSTSGLTVFIVIPDVKEQLARSQSKCQVH